MLRLFFVFVTRQVRCAYVIRLHVKSHIRFVFHALRRYEGVYIAPYILMLSSLSSIRNGPYGAYIKLNPHQSSSASLSSTSFGIHRQQPASYSADARSLSVFQLFFARQIIIIINLKKINKCNAKCEISFFVCETMEGKRTSRKFEFSYTEYTICSCLATGC